MFATEDEYNLLEEEEEEDDVDNRNTYAFDDPACDLDETEKQLRQIPDNLRYWRKLKEEIPVQRRDTIDR